MSRYLAGNHLGLNPVVMLNVPLKRGIIYFEWLCAFGLLLNKPELAILAFNFERVDGPVAYLDWIGAHGAAAGKA